MTRSQAGSTGQAVDPGAVADEVAAVALSVPGVTGLHTGAFGEVATHLPGRKVDGVRLREDVTEVHLVVAMGSDVLSVAESVRAAVKPLVAATVVNVFVEDVTPG